jgi:hypothetical protein
MASYTHKTMAAASLSMGIAVDVFGTLRRTLSKSSSGRR